MNKILDGAKEALAVARGEIPAAGTTSFVGGPYDKGNKQRPLIQHRSCDHWIVWNWDNVCWDKSSTPVKILPL